MLCLFHPVMPLFAMLVLLTGCASPNSSNQISRITGDNGRVPLASDDRYQNLFPGSKDYAVTCTKDCYQPHPEVICDQSANNAPSHCRYTGKIAGVSLRTGIQVHWLGHASFYLTMPDGTTLLIDPVSQQFDWPVNWLHAIFGGYTRPIPAWPDDKTLQATDAVLYSHLHYDHFNKDDIELMGNSPRYFVHQDTASYLPDAGLNVVEMSWFSEYRLGKTTVHAVPAHHFNSRYYVPLLYDDNEQALWGGWITEFNGKTLFFAGDTGYSPHFKAIRKQHGDIDICLLPIASYYHEEYGNWYRYVHTTPEDALTAASDLGCKAMIPWGYGNYSWQMGDHSSHAPLLRLLHMHEKLGRPVPLIILNEGESVRL